MTHRTTHSTARTTSRLGVVLAAAALGLAGCASDGAAADDTDAPAAEEVTVSDAWVKAADSGMSAAFGELTNTGAEDVTITSVSTEAAAMVEQHETVENETGEMTMREVEGGLVVPAGGTLVLEPGGNHLMLMDLTGPIEAGEEVTVTLTYADGSTADLTAPVKDYSGANESYGGGSDHDHEDADGTGDSDDMDMEG
ncbi:copper chaperone PCu(A)C [Isoptericola sp. BMS4]|uniref:copper chaperone PCu(A)C n=1 Tax=Isoptericola sp. BMS4 TaxID=2527875 RepID=UPI00141DBE4D|nr:copper chaperone PCu(A)C [Isoptericola sp. BMS4]